MADHHRYFASSSAAPPRVPLSPSLAKFRAMGSKDDLSLSPPGVPSRKRKLDQELTKAFTAAADDDDGPAPRQYKITKKLTQSDTNRNCRLLLPKESVEDYILSLMGENLALLCRSDIGVGFEVWDVDTSSKHHLVLKKRKKNGSFVLTGGWIKDFVRRKELKSDDVVGLSFDGTKIFFKLLNKN